MKKQKAHMGTTNNEKVEKKTMLLGNIAVPNEITNYCVSPPTPLLTSLTRVGAEDGVKRGLGRGKQDLIAKQVKKQT